MVLLLNMFVIGQAKCGTTALHDLLDQHPQICMSSPKETYLFTKSDETRPAIEKYFSHWQGEPLRGEATPVYLGSREHLSRIYQHNSSAKILICLRDPVERAYSQWCMDASISGLFQKKSSFPRTLRAEIQAYDSNSAFLNPSNIIEFLAGKECCNILAQGLYAPLIRRVLDIFPGEQVKIVWNDDLKSPNSAFLQSLWEFLCLPPCAKLDARRVNVTVGPLVGKLRQVAQAFGIQRWFPTRLGIALRNFIAKRGDRWAPMAPRERNLLENFYAPYDQELADLIGVPVPWRNAPLFTPGNAP